MGDSEGLSAFLHKMVISVFLVLAAMAAVWTGINAWDLSKEREALQEDQRRLEMIGEISPKVEALAKAGYTEEKRREERRTGNWTSFFASTAQAAGMAGTQYRLPARKTSKGKGFREHYFEIRLNPNTGISRQGLARFLWLVESRRTYLKVRSVHLKRPREIEDWGGVATVAYREKR